MVSVFYTSSIIFRYSTSFRVIDRVRDLGDAMLRLYASPDLAAGAFLQEVYAYRSQQDQAVTGTLKSVD